MRAGSRVAGLFACLAVILSGAAVSSDVSSASAHRAANNDTTTRHVVFTITSDQVTESSSLAVSTVHRGLVYTTNDSGDQATVYVLDAATGDLVGRTSLAGVVALDVEALAIGTDGTLVVGDVGDNHGERDFVDLYRLRQPGRGEASVTPEAVRLTYPDGPRDAESLLYDAGTGRVFVASKRLAGAKVYRSPPGVFDRGRARLTTGADAPALATDATFLHGERFAVIRTYFSAAVYRYPSWRRVTGFDLPPQPQGESLAAPPGGQALWIGSEGARSKVLQVALPDLNAAPSAPAASTDTRSTVITSVETTAVESPRREQWRSIARVVLATAGVALLIVIGVGLALYRRRHTSA
ncbi:MAG: hypothetical protein H0V07_12220 [Propionibacteriales bacterium]|nr:hypothetical protein [Propionibacteriales bacterium]